ncbi:PREDICTED: uncharacterized protein LOC109192059 [Ipomoea nil]|uniref:uncharacterized protein LOC109192059 n=1 Tax=Ipomoea nil TaxID=35883 RepID=UPI000901AF6A|nr:PREDICTED: uncharacterized protein LOC109192059 [Ipomoea nil]
MVDIRKAYDTVSWDFLREALEGFGFPSIFTGWIMECVQTASFSVSINGNIKGKFNGEAGTEARRSHVADAFYFMHGIFLEDAEKGDTSSVEILMQALNELEGTSGLAINATKSKLFCAGVREDLSFTRIPAGTLPVRYLGVPLDAQKLRVSNYGPLFDSINKYISVWKGFCLSYAENSCGVGKRALVAWDVICKPKDEGGLGLRSLKHWNEAFMTKIIWNIHARKETLWIRWVHDFYLSNKDFWTWKPGEGGLCLNEKFNKN